jgi:hypothetical protein
MKGNPGGASPREALRLGFARRPVRQRGRTLKIEHLLDDNVCATGTLTINFF